MEDRPAGMAGPDFGVWRDLIDADGTFVITSRDVLVGPSGYVGR